MNKSTQKILLIEPPFFRLFKDNYSLERYPLSLGYLAGAIKSNTNWDVVVYNSDFNPQSESVKNSYLAGQGFDNYLNNLNDFSKTVWREIRMIVSEYRPNVVGISAKSQNFASACRVAKIIKEVDKQIIIVMGGPHPSMVGSKILINPDIDFCVKGEGEMTLVELLNAIDSQQEYNTIAGLIYKKDGCINENKPRKFIENLDLLCFPHEYASKVLKDCEKYPLTAFRNIFAIRGCPYNCLFCGSRNVWTRQPRFRSPQHIIREIKGLQKMGLKAIHFEDDTFGISKKYIKALCNTLMNECPNLRWSCELHVKLVDEETIAIMKKAGCYSIQIGIESGNNAILKDMRKNITIEEALLACNIIKKQSIELAAFFMIGFPQETESTLYDTISAMKKTKCDLLIYSIFTPYPATDAFEICKKDGLISDDYDVSLYNHQSPVNCFCRNIKPERFRVLASNIEKMVDRKNSLNRVRRIFSLRSLWTIKEVGLARGLRRGINILCGK